MRIRVFSDIHLDVNEKFPFNLHKEKDEFTLIAGDVSGNVKLTAKWIKDNIKQGAFIVGNHDPAYNDMGWTVKKAKSYLAERFGVDDAVTFMDEQVGVMSKMIPNSNIMVIGSALYTDYQYLDKRTKNYFDVGNKARKERNEEPMNVETINIEYALRGLNDFRWGKVEDEADDRGLKQRNLRPSDYLAWFNTTFAKMKELVESNKDKDIIILTHHCPTPMVIASDYVESRMNASYVSDLEDFIEKHPNIRAWCCGHVHNRKFLELGDNRQLIVCNPRGYEQHFECDDWSPNTFIDTESWKVVVEPYSNPKLEFKRKEAHDRFMKYAPLFI